MAMPRILFVDDEENILLSIQRSLRGEPLEILTASSAARALEILARESVDVIVSDDRMPGMSGSDLLAEVNRLYPEVCKIMLTGHGTFTSAVRTINEARIFRFLLKPVSAEELVGIIHHALQERTRSQNLLALSQQAGNVCSCMVRFNDSSQPASFLWSENTRTVLGLGPGEALDSWDILGRRLHSEDRELVASTYRSCLAEEACSDLEYRVVLDHGLIRWISQTCEISRDKKGRPLHLLLVLKDITEERRHREWLEEKAFQDNLTGLGNRAQLFRSLEDALSRRMSVNSIAILFLDLDDFKLINDSLGHAIGDWVLQVFAERLRDAVSEETTVIRLGGDEFALVFCGPLAEEQAERSARYILAGLEAPFLLQDYEFHISASIGIAANIAPRYSAEDLLRDADTAMYVAKSQGKGGYQVFTEAMHNRAAARFNLQADMRRALTDHQIVPFYQPIIRLDDLTLAGYEALARWRHPEKGLIMPAEFIPVAEESGLITSLGMIMMDAACAQARRWRDLFAGSRQTMSINVSCLQFRQVDLVRRVEEIIDRHGLEPGLIKIEITESGVMDDAELSLAILAGLKKLGVHLQIDDFGTGYSSLSYLRRIPAESIKIDQSFIIGMESDREKQAIVRTIIDLAFSMCMKVIAEGVETGEQLALLRSLGCHYGQGFLFDKPLPPEEAELRRDYSRLAGVEGGCGLDIHCTPQISGTDE